MQYDSSAIGYEESIEGEKSRLLKSVKKNLHFKNKVTLFLPNGANTKSNVKRGSEAIIEFAIRIQT